MQLFSIMIQKTVSGSVSGGQADLKLFIDQYEESKVQREKEQPPFAQHQKGH